tara:strand:+ start:25529 stop:25951 length:423 start_codon:yes stop_codon:yes gene_type:complete
MSWVSVGTVRAFHEKFGMAYEGPLRMLPEDLSNFRIHFLIEELEEYVKAETLEDKLDALVDLIYVALGTADLHGIKNPTFIRAFKTVHIANMQKIKGKSDRSDKFDVIKPKGWKAPDLKTVLNEQLEFNFPWEKKNDNSS